MEQSGNIKPNKYNHGNIYKLVNSNGFYYVGSTCSSLSKRLSQHKGMSKAYPNRKVYKQITNWDDIRIVLIVNVSVENKEQLLREEDKHIIRNDPFCLNSCNAFLTEEEREHRQKQYCIEYRNENKEKIQLYEKKYRNENKEKIQLYKQKYCNENKIKLKAQRSQLTKCICGSEITKDGFNQHTKTQKHQQFFKDNEQENVSL